MAFMLPWLVAHWTEYRAQAPTNAVTEKTKLQLRAPELGACHRPSLSAMSATKSCSLWMIHASMDSARRAVTSHP
jgi:hypothetical protein